VPPGAAPSDVLTARLRCTRPRAGDESAYRELLLDERVGAWLRPPPLEPYDDAAVAARLASDVAHWDEHGFGPWLLSDRADGSLVGRGGFNWTTVAGTRAVELPWSIVPARWGEGLATEAAAAALDTALALGIDERVIVSFALRDNGRSLRVMEKIGLERVGDIEHANLPHVLYSVTGSAPPQR
jgi:RimJ/RimL family protein N-acetyltransferase